jgi:hypothetical protein
MNTDQPLIGYTFKIKLRKASLAWIRAGFEKAVIAIAKQLTNIASSEDERDDAQRDLYTYTHKLEGLDDYDLQVPISGCEDEIEINIDLYNLRGFYCAVAAVAKDFERQLENDKLTIEERAVCLKNKASCDSLFVYLKQSYDSGLLLMPKE